MKIRACFVAFAALALFALASAANAQTVSYTNQATFLSNVASGSYLQNFDSLVQGTFYANPITFGGGNGFQYNVGAATGLYAVSGNGGSALSTFDPADPIQINFTGRTVTALGGNFFNSDYNGDYASGGITLTLSNGSSLYVAAAALTDFRGFTVSSGSITSLRIGGGDGSTQYPTVDNLIVGGYSPAATATVTGNIALEGVKDLSKTNAKAPLGVFDIQFRAPGSLTPLYEFKTVTLTRTAGSANGKYTLTGIPAGKYDVWLKGPKNLAALVSNVTIAGTTGTVANVLLNGGDVDNDNAISPTDFATFVSAYNSSAAIAGTGYDPTSDFNFDGLVDPTDFGVFVSNYNTAGAN